MTYIVIYDLHLEYFILKYLICKVGQVNYRQLQISYFITFQIRYPSIYIQFKHKHFTAGMTHSAATPVAESGHFKHLNEM